MSVLGGIDKGFIYAGFSSYGAEVLLICWLDSLGYVQGKRLRDTVLFCLLLVRSFACTN
jgi:hypothetical protein